MRQLLVESMMLAIPGALLGVAMAWLAGPMLLQGLKTPQTQVSLPTRPDFAVLAITGACASLCALLFGMAPAWAASRTNFETASSVVMVSVLLVVCGPMAAFVPARSCGLHRFHAGVADGVGKTQLGCNWDRMQRLASVYGKSPSHAL
jgi:hypothetical protein